MLGEVTSYSQEGLTYLQDELLIIDWATQAAGFAEMYRQTGDPDFELMRACAEVKAEKQKILFQQITELESLLQIDPLAEGV